MAMDETAAPQAAGDWLDELTGGMVELAGAVTSPTVPAPSPAAPVPGTQASPGAAQTPETPAATPATESQTSGTPAHPTPTNPDGTPATTTTAPTPFTFKADGREITPDGATVTPTGAIQFTPEGWSKFRTEHVADRNGIAQRIEGLQRQAAQARQQVSEVQQQRGAGEAQAEAIVGKLTEWHALGPDQFATKIFEMFDQFPTLLANAKAEHWRREAERVTQAQAPVQQQQAWDAAAPTFWPAFREMLTEQLAQPEFADLAGQADQVFADLQALGTAEGLVGFDAHGRPSYDEKTFWRELRRMAQVEKRVVEARKAAALTTRNAAQLAKPNTPPVVGATPAVPAAGATGQPLTRAQQKQKLRDELDSDEAFARSLSE